MVFNAPKMLMYPAVVNDCKVHGAYSRTVFYYHNILLYSNIMVLNSQFSDYRLSKFFNFLYQLQNCCCNMSLVIFQDHMKFIDSLCLAFPISVMIFTTQMCCLILNHFMATNMEEQQMVNSMEKQ